MIILSFENRTNEKQKTEKKIFLGSKNCQQKQKKLMNENLTAYVCQCYSLSMTMIMMTMVIE